MQASRLLPQHKVTCVPGCGNKHWACIRCHLKHLKYEGAFPCRSAKSQPRRTPTPFDIPTPPLPLSHGLTADEQEKVLSNVQHTLSIFPPLPQHSLNRSILATLSTEHLSEKTAGEFLNFPCTYIHNARQRVHHIDLLSTSLFSHYPPDVLGGFMWTSLLSARKPMSSTSLRLYNSSSRTRPSSPRC